MVEDKDIEVNRSQSGGGEKGVPGMPTKELPTEES